MYDGIFKRPVYAHLLSPSLARANILNIYICVCGFCTLTSTLALLGLHNPFTLTGFLQDSTTVPPVPPARAGQGTVLFRLVKCKPCQCIDQQSIRLQLERCEVLHSVGSVCSTPWSMRWTRGNWVLVTKQDRCAAVAS